MIAHLTQWIETHVMPSPELAMIGFVAAIFGACVLVWIAFGWAKSAVMSLLGYAGFGRPSAATSPGYRVQIAPVSGLGGRRAKACLKASLTDFLPGYSFGAPFQLGSSSALEGGNLPGTFDRARKRLARSGCDMLIWGERVSGRDDGLRYYGVARTNGRRAEDAESFDIIMSGDASARTETFQKTLAYLVAKQLQPALSRPEGFRPERIADVTKSLDELLNDGAALPEHIRAEVEADFCANALHIAEAGKSPEWLAKTVALRRAAISRLDGAGDSDGSAQARLDLGRALLYQADQAYDAALIQEAVQHLNAATEVLKNDPAIRRAQQATDAISKARHLVDSRKRFAVNFNA